MSKRKAEDDPPAITATDATSNGGNNPIAKTYSNAGTDIGVIPAVAKPERASKRPRRRREDREWTPPNTDGPASRTRARTKAMTAEVSPILGSSCTSAAPPALHSAFHQLEGRESKACTGGDLTLSLNNDRAPGTSHSMLEHPSLSSSNLNNGPLPSNVASADQGHNSADEGSMVSPSGRNSNVNPASDGISDKADSNTSNEGSDTAETLTTAQSGKTEPAGHVNLVKSDPLRQPRVWAYTRSALGDSCPYYQARQGSTYHKLGKVFGMLVDGHGTDHDVFLPQVIITSVGGGREQDPDSKKMVVSRNRKEDDPAVTRFLAAKASGDSIPIIVGDKNPLCPVKLPHPYCVLDFFHVTDVWPEVEINKGQRMNLWMVRFEKVDLDAQEWWASQDQQGLGHYLPGQYICERTTCRTCQRESKQIYDQGWTCLNSNCSKHFKFDPDLPMNRPTYSQVFLCERSAARRSNSELELIPPLPTHTSLGGDPTFGTESAMKKGVVCRNCGCCSRRKRWKIWECENPTCDWTYSLDFRDYPIDNVLREVEAFMSKKTKMVFKSDWLKSWGFEFDGYTAEAFAFPDEDHTVIGVAVVLRATREICSKSGGPDELFRNLQRDDLLLQRKAARGAGSRIEELTSHFLSNWGAFYKFGVTVGTTGFDKAPESILRSLSQLTWAQERVVQNVAQQMSASGKPYSKESMSLQSERFNELLSLGYFESSHISYHDDGEKELGPTVATLSLGSPSIMRFQPKKNNPVGDKDDNRKINKPPVLSFPLYHGDIVIMHGTQIHKLYNHAVQPFGKLRFALTCRSIRIETIQDAAKQQESIEKGKIPEGIEGLAYKGTAAVSSVDLKEATTVHTDDTEDADNTSAASVTIEEAIAAHTDDPESDGSENGSTTPLAQSQLIMTAAESFRSSWMQCRDHLYAHPDLFADFLPSQREELIRELSDVTQQLRAPQGMPTP